MDMMEESAGMQGSNPPAWRGYLAGLTVALMPLSFNIEKYIAGSKSPVYVSPFDFLLPVMLLWLIIDLFGRKPWVAFRIPPVFSLIWAAVAIASILWTSSFPDKEILRAGAKAALNTLLFGLAGVWVFQNLSVKPGDYRKLLLVLGASFSICVLLALKEYVGPVGVPYDPSDPTKNLGGVTNVRLGGWYDYRGVFGAEAAMMVPAAVAVALLETDVVIRIAAIGVAIVSICVTMAGGGFIAECAGVLAVAGGYAVWSRKCLSVVAVVAGLILLCLVVLPRLPRNNPSVIFRSVALYAEDTDKAVDNNSMPKPTARLRRYQAALDLLASSDPWKQGSWPYWRKGVGSGQYQKNIDKFYQPPYQKPGKRGDEEAAYDMESDERFSWGFLETTAVELGLPGLIAVTLVFASWIAAGFGAFACAQSGEQSEESRVCAMLALAALGAGVGALVSSIFLTPIIRGVGGSFAFFYALALVSAMWARGRVHTGRSGL